MPIKSFEMVLEGDEKAVRHLGGVEHRLRSGREAWEDVMEVLEDSEMEFFIRQRGRYIDTGRLAKSLTEQNGADVIRDIHGDGLGLDFGTSVFYAKFLTKKRRDPPAGQVRGRKRKGKSAVLVLTASARKQAVKVVLDYVMGPNA